jgi:glyoxylase-like metal-dependent hydrolase (beta-lactamase superfamily II)
MTHDVALIRAANPGPFTLEGTNTYVYGRDPAWLVDPGPALDDHVAAVRAEVAARGGLGGIALTHHHADHSEAVPLFEVEVQGADSPFTTVPTPGHTSDHVSFVTAGSVIVPGDLAEYLAALRHLRGLALTTLYPGHGPVVEDPAAKIDEYIAHRLDRERRLLIGLESGARSVDEMLDAAWDDVPDALRFAAAIALGAHLEKLEAEGRLPQGVERPPREVPEDV